MTADGAAPATGRDFGLADGGAAVGADLSRCSLNQATVKHATLAEAVAVAAAAGFGAVGLWRDRVQEVGPERARRLVEAAGLRVSSLCRGGFMTTADEAGIQLALADNRRAIAEAFAVGARELILVVGGLPAQSGPGQGVRPDATAADRDLAAARQRVADRLADLLPEAADADVRLVLEPMHPLFTADRGVISTTAQALDMAAPFPPEQVGVVVDTYHTWWDPDLAAAIARAGAEGRLASYQIGDWILPLAANSLNSRGHVGDGYIDFATVTSWIAAAGYTGDIETEIFNEAIWSADPAATAATVGERYARLVLPHLAV
ncbi:MAG: sugar phosphate isomerase/epimerase [Propionibacteriaceae bacterium]|jgi:sugar phosphate isomerase/epimerase|nr:sugar phosphate isomerase/epimerase [Propionibacteriaceae bacterium]